MLACAALAVCGAGCASSARLKPPAVPQGTGLEVVREGSGPGVAVIAPSARGAAHGPVELAMFIDAGARDAQPPQVATLAAWLTADAVGHGAQGRAWSEGIEVRLRCAEALERCTEWLARGLALRDVNAKAFAAAHARLVNGRRSADARDDGRQADRLALLALYGDDASALVPLGDAARDGDVDAAHVQAFLARHFGVQHALIAASHGVQAPAFAKLCADAFGDVPRAHAAASDATGWKPLDAHEGVRVEVGDRARLSLALTASTVAAAERAASRLRDELVRGGVAKSVEGRGTSTREGGLVLLRVRTRDAERALERARYVVASLRNEGASDASQTARGGGPLAAMRRLGTRYAARSSEVATAATTRVDFRSLALGAGVLVAGGRADHLKARDPDAALAATARSRFEAAFARGLALAHPQLATVMRGDVYEATLDNRARVAVQPRVGESVVIAVKLLPGASADPPIQHGRAALLATAATTACAGHSREALRVKLDAIGAGLEPHVDAESWGLSMRVPTQNVEAGVALAVECALRPSLAMADLVAARLALRDRLASRARAGEWRARIAATLAPAAPGVYAAWGSDETLPSVNVRALEELLAASLHGPSVAVGVVGPVDAEKVSLAAARRLGVLDGKSAQVRASVSTAFANAGSRDAEVGAATKTEHTALPRSSLRSLSAQRVEQRARAAAAKKSSAAVDAQRSEPVSEALFVWRVDGAAAEGRVEGDADQARAFAAAAAEALARDPSLAVTWSGGDAQRGFVWAAVAVRAASARLATLPAEVSSLGPRLPRPALARVAQLAAQERPLPGAAELANSIAVQALGARADAPAAGRPSGAAQVLEGLATATPSFVPTR